MARAIVFAFVCATVLLSQAPDPISVEDQLQFSRMQLEALKVVLRLKDDEIKLLRARVEQLEAQERIRGLSAEAMKHKTAIDVKEQALKTKYKTPAGYKVSEDAQWEKIAGSSGGKQ